MVVKTGDSSSLKKLKCMTQVKMVVKAPTDKSTANLMPIHQNSLEHRRRNHLLMMVLRLLIPSTNNSSCSNTRSFPKSNSPNIKERHRQRKNRQGHWNHHHFRQCHHRLLSTNMRTVDIVAAATVQRAASLKAVQRQRPLPLSLLCLRHRFRSHHSHHRRSYITTNLPVTR